MNITKNNFEKEVLHCKNLVIVDFWAAWCGPCRMLSPIIEEIAQERNDIKVGKVNVDEEMELAKQYGIMSIPTLIIFYQGKIINQITGFRTKDDLNEILDNSLLEISK